MDQYTFDLYFASILAIQFHPGNPEDKRMSLEQCGAIALRAVQVRNHILNEVHKCPSSLPSYPPVQA